MKVTLARFIEAPVCANCCDYVDFPRRQDDRPQERMGALQYRQRAAPGQQDDDIDDRGEPLIDRGCYVIGFDPAGLPVCGTMPR
jgi:hypothetical protein